MAEFQPSKLAMRVRFPSPAPKLVHAGIGGVGGSATEGPSGPWYVAGPNPRIGKKMNGKKISPTVKPTPLPKHFDRPFQIIRITMFTIGMRNSGIHHHGRPMIFNRMIVL